MEKDCENIIDSLVLVRKKRGMKQVELAEHLGITQASMSRIETQKSIPSLNQIVLMCEKLETQIVLRMLI